MIEILDPTVAASTQPIAFSPRPSALAGKRIALIENTKHNSDALLRRIGDVLKQEYGVAEWRMYRKHNAGVPAHQEIIEAIKTSADVVVAGIGD
ncbi:MAG TPA: hypothetical protein VHZ49_04940 [Methylomirabilota bacterium]|jgi:hypothetical protein|nr:hypothetical protein [Methylomirabilota bacterium]